MDDIARKLAIRDSLLRKMPARQTLDELMREMWRMQQASWERLKRIPQAWDFYKRRQFKQRAIDVRPEYLELRANLRHAPRINACYIRPLVKIATTAAKSKINQF